MSEVASKYDLVINITNAQHTFTGNNRNAHFVASAPELITAANCTQIFAPSAQALAMGENDFTIKYARIISSGAAGVQTPELSRASQLNFGLCKQDGTELDSVLLKFQNWNEWTEINAVLRPYKSKPTWLDAEIINHKPVYFSPKVQYSYYNVDDYNINSAYVGQTFSPVLEMIVETSGMLEDYAHNIF